MANRPRVKWMAHLVLIVCSVVFIGPFLWMVSTSLKTETAIFPKPGHPPQWIPRTDLRDEAGRRQIVYQGREGVEIGHDEDGRSLIEVAGEQQAVWPEEIGRASRRERV